MRSCVSWKALQAEYAKQNDPVEMEDVGYAQCKAEDYAEYANPV